MAQERSALLDLTEDTELLLELTELALLKVKDGNPIQRGETAEEDLYLIPQLDENGVAIEGDTRKYATRQQVAAYYWRLDNLVKRLNAFLLVAKSNVDAASKRLGEMQDTEGLSKFSQVMEDGTTATFKLVVEDYVSIKAEQRDQAFAWLIANGMGGIIKPTVNAATLKSQINAFLRAGAEDEEGDDNVPPPDDGEEGGETEPIQQGENVIRQNVMYFMDLLSMLPAQSRDGMTLPEDSFNQFTVIKTKMSRSRTKAK